MHYVPFCVQLLSFNTLLVRFIDVVVCGCRSFTIIVVEFSAV